MSRPQQSSSSTSKSSSPKKKLITKTELTLFLVFMVLMVILIVAAIFLVFYQKAIPYSSPPATRNPEKDLSEFVENYFSEYYRPAVIQSIQLINLPLWEYSWAVEEEYFNAFVKYNENNNYINRIAGIANLNQDIALDQDSAVQLTADIFNSVVPGGEWGCGSLGVELLANPSSGEAPLRNVDLVAAISGTVKGEINYKFDCTSDGIWEKEITTDENPYIAIDLCDYIEDRIYTARVKIERGGMIIGDTTDSSPKNIIQCRNKWIFNKNKYEVIISKLKDSQFVNAGFCIIPNNSNHYEEETCFE